MAQWCRSYCNFPRKYLIIFSPLKSSDVYAPVTYAIIGSDNGLSPGRRQAISKTDAGILLIGLLGTNLNVVCEMASILSRSQCVNLNVSDWILRGRTCDKKIPKIKRLHYFCDLTMFWAFKPMAAHISKEMGLISWHCNDVIMSAMASQISGASIVCSIVFQAQIKENIKAPRHWPLWGETTEWPVESLTKG